MRRSSPAEAPPRAALLLGAAITALASGCAAPHSSRSKSPPLPFAVRVKITDVPPPPQESAPSAATVPAAFGQDRALLEARLASSLEEVGLFSRVFAATGDSEVRSGDEDLVLEVSIQGQDFGPGRVSPGSAVLSTLTWICAGHLAWLIEDRYYPDSDVAMTVSIHRPLPAKPEAAGESQPIYIDPLPIQDLEAAFIERVDAGRSFLNIFLPPWWGDGSPAVTGASLAGKSFAYFARQEPAQIQSRLPALYFEDAGAFLVFDAASRRVIIVSRRDLRSITLRGSGQAREISGKALDSPAHLVTRERPGDLEDLEQRVSERARGIGRKSHYYRVDLDEDEDGLIRVEAELGDGSPAGRWTIAAAPVTPAS